MEPSEHSLAFLAGTLTLILEGLSLLCILLGLLITGQYSLSQSRRLWASPNFLAQVRLSFGRWLSLALEFQLGADIANTTIAPSFQALAKLAAIALIRTFLNYFLNKELVAETVRSEQPATPTPVAPTER